jgi:hypothetical protein
VVPPGVVPPGVVSPGAVSPGGVSSEAAGFFESLQAKAESERAATTALSEQAPRK